MFMRGFDADQREKLAAVTAFLLTVGLIPTSVLSKLLQDHLIKDGCALNFLLSCLKRWSEEKDAATIWSALRRYQVRRHCEWVPFLKRKAKWDLRMHKIKAIILLHAVYLPLD